MKVKDQEWRKEITGRKKGRTYGYDKDKRFYEKTLHGKKGYDKKKEQERMTINDREWKGVNIKMNKIGNKRKETEG